jgi:predicted nucleic acid-binding protein
MSINCLLPCISNLANHAQIIVPQAVFDEIITNPAKTLRFRLGSIRFSKLVANGIISVKSVSEKKVAEITNLANKIFWFKGNPIKIMHTGEAEALVLAIEFNAILLLDERTIRILVEEPSALRYLLEQRMHKKISIDYNAIKSCRKILGNIPIIRTTELVTILYEHNLLELGHSKEVLEACLWALKFSGCAITKEEIKECTNSSI